MDIDITYDIVDLVNYDDKESFSDIINCSICMDTFINKQIYQCKEGHHACLECWKNVISSNKKVCFTCRMKVESFNNLSRNRSMESMIASKRVNCPNSLNIVVTNGVGNSGMVSGKHLYSAETKQITINSIGCKEKIKIEEIESHMAKCRFKIVQCSYQGCGFVGRLNEYNSSHQDECNYRVVECRECREKLKRIELNDHLDFKCPLVTISCFQCKTSLKRNQLMDHIDNECDNTIIKCKYSKLCKEEFKRSKLSVHLKQANHLEEMKNIIDNNEKEIQTYRSQLNDANERCNSLIKDFSIISRAFSNFDRVYSNRWEVSQFKSKIKQLSLQDSIYSSIFKVGQYQFYLGLSLTGMFGYNNIDSDYLSIYLYICESDINDFPISIKCDFEIVNQLDDLKNKKVLLDGQYDIPQDQDVYIEKVLSKLSDISTETGYLSSVGDTLLINFTITIINTSNPPLKS